MPTSNQFTAGDLHRSNLCEEIDMEQSTVFTCYRGACCPPYCCRGVVRGTGHSTEFIPGMFAGGPLGGGPPHCYDCMKANCVVSS